MTIRVVEVQGQGISFAAWPRGQKVMELGVWCTPTLLHQRVKFGGSGS